ncbi:MAG: alpha/beta fold hydrolase [Thiogranum sp.]|nr:alpha/beta fold hydrolase [Thiogranum sp.]
MDSVDVAVLSVATVFAVTILLIHIGFRAPRRVEKGSPADFGLPYREVRVHTRSGKKLFAWWLPAAPSAPVIILMHGWGGNAEMMLPLALPLFRAGMNLLLLDARNHGRSDSASFSSMPRFAEDVDEAIDWIKAQEEGGTDRIVLLGHSVGGGAVLLAASRRQDIAAVISIAAFAHPEWMMRRYLARLRLPNPLIRGILRYIEWVIGHRYETIAPMNTACRIQCPVLLIHGTTDTTVPMRDATTIRDNCRDGTIELLFIEGADHESVELIEDHADQMVLFLDKIL